MLGGSVSGEGLPKVVRRVSFVSLEGNGSGKVSTSVENIRNYLANMGNPEREQAETLRRVNAWRAAVWLRVNFPFFLGYPARPIFGAGFRFWRSAPRPRAVRSWETGQKFPMFSHFRKLPGLFPLAADLPKVRKESAEGQNSAAAYFEHLGAETLNRVRSSSPRWRGTARHKAERVRLLPFAFSTEEFRKLLAHQAWVKDVGRLQKKFERNTVRGRTAAEFVKVYLELYAAAKKKGTITALSSVTNTLRTYIRLACRSNLLWLRELLRILREARASADTFAGYVALSNAVNFLELIAEELAERPELEPIPPPPDLLPRPPVAPLAPPA